MPKRLGRVTSQLAAGLPCSKWWADGRAALSVGPCSDFAQRGRGGIFRRSPVAEVLENSMFSGHAAEVLGSGRFAPAEGMPPGSLGRTDIWAVRRIVAPGFGGMVLEVASSMSCGRTARVLTQPTRG